MKQLFFILLLFGFSSCHFQTEPSKPVHNDQTTIPLTTKNPAFANIDYDVSQWMELLPDEEGLILDLRYATSNNFTSSVIYPCGRCFLRPQLAQKIKTLQRDIKNRYGLGLKLFDCYRPRPAQQKLWDIVPNEMYVTNPKKGSMHNRGLAVDVTLVDSKGEELDMGTTYDHFGREAHVDYMDLSEEVLKNRTVLQKMMEIHGLKGIQSEWWHFSLKSVQAPLDDWQWSCKDSLSGTF